MITANVHIYLCVRLRIHTYRFAVGLIVEAMGIGVAVGQLEAHRQAPALAGPHRLAAMDFPVPLPLVPGQHEAGRQAGAGGGHRFQVELEAAALVEGLGKGRDHPHYFHVPPFPFGDQAVGQPGFGPPGRPAETEGDPGQERQPPGPGLSGPAQARCGQEETGHGPRPPGRYFRLELEGQDADGKGGNIAAHAAIIEKDAYAQAP